MGGNSSKKTVIDIDPQTLQALLVATLQSCQRPVSEVQAPQPLVQAPLPLVQPLVQAPPPRVQPLVQPLVQALEPPLIRLVIGSVEYFLEQRMENKYEGFTYDRWTIRIEESKCVICKNYEVLYTHAATDGGVATVLNLYNQSWLHANGATVSGVRISRFMWSPYPEEYRKWIKSNVITIDGVTMPLSYDVMPSYYLNLPGYTEADMKTATDSVRYNAAVEVFNQSKGINIYDASLWAIEMSRKGNTDEMKAAVSWMELLGKGDGHGKTIMGSKSGTSWTYNGSATDWASDSYGNLGFNIRMVAAGAYKQVIDNRFCTILNSKIGGAFPGNDVTVLELGTTATKVDQLYMTWSDYRPVAGENAWSGLIATMHMYGMATDAQRTGVLLPYMTRVLNTMERLRFAGGGIYYSPQSTNNVDWNVHSFSVENLASISAGLNMVTEVLEKHPEEKYSSLAKRALLLRDEVVKFVVNHAVQWSPHSYYTFHDVKGQDMEVKGPSIAASGECIRGTLNCNGKDFALDIYTWGISVWATSFEKQQTGSCYDLWQTAKKYCAYKDAQGQFAGVGYSVNVEANVLSGEWTAGAINMCRILARSVYKDDDDKRLSLEKDIEDMTYGIRRELVTLSDKQKAGAGVYYANKKYSIPFGWIAQRNVSMASTTWTYWLEEEFNPFRIDGQYQPAW